MHLGIITPSAWELDRSSPALAKAGASGFGIYLLFALERFTTETKTEKKISRQKIREIA